MIVDFQQPVELPPQQVQKQVSIAEEATVVKTVEEDSKATEAVTQQQQTSSDDDIKMPSLTSVNK